MPGVPTKILDVRNGNGIVDGADSQPFAFYVAFKDSASKTELIDAVADAANYNALDPATRPTKTNFALKEIQTYLKNKLRDARQSAIEAAKPPVNITDLP